MSGSEPKPSWWQLANPADAKAALGYVAQQVLLGSLCARDANALTGTISALVSVIRETDLERRLDQLEVALKVRR